MVSTAEAILDAPGRRSEAEEEIVRIAEKQLRLIALGVPDWHTRTDESR